jgi:hypothetical protein
LAVDGAVMAHHDRTQSEIEEMETATDILHDEDCAGRGYHADRQISGTQASPNTPDTALVCIKSVREGERLAAHYLHYCTIAELQQKVLEMSRAGFRVTSVSRVPGS